MSVKRSWMIPQYICLPRAVEWCLNKCGYQRWWNDSSIIWLSGVGKLGLTQNYGCRGNYWQWNYASVNIVIKGNQGRIQNLELDNISVTIYLGCDFYYNLETSFNILYWISKSTLGNDMIPRPIWLTMAVVEWCLNKYDCRLQSNDASIHGYPGQWNDGSVQ